MCDEEESFCSWHCCCKVLLEGKRPLFQEYLQQIKKHKAQMDNFENIALEQQNKQEHKRDNKGLYIQPSDMEVEGTNYTAKATTASNLELVSNVVVNSGHVPATGSKRKFEIHQDEEKQAKLELSTSDLHGHKDKNKKDNQSVEVLKLSIPMNMVSQSVEDLDKVNGSNLSISPERNPKAKINGANSESNNAIVKLSVPGIPGLGKPTPSVTTVTVTITENEDKDKVVISNEAVSNIPCLLDPTVIANVPLPENEDKMVIDQETKADDSSSNLDGSTSTKYNYRNRSEFHKCGHCGKKFGSASSLKWHEKEHKLEASNHFECIDCGKSYSTPARYENHLKVHPKCLLCLRRMTIREMESQSDGDGLNVNVCKKCRAEDAPILFRRKSTIDVNEPSHQSIYNDV